MNADNRNRMHRPGSRRTFLKVLASLASLGLYAKDFLAAPLASAQTGALGVPLPDEAVEATLKRLFGSRNFVRGDDKIKLELPQIAEDGGNVAITIDSTLPVAGAVHVRSVYIISDKNRRPLLAKLTFTPELGRVFVSTSIRLAATTDVRVIAEINDGTLYSVAKHVRVTISGCDLPPQN
jgi:sulfur-oxidizing protein SoxY